MNPYLHELIAIARTVKMTEEERELQAISFAYGNVRLENENATRAGVQEALQRLKQAHARTT
jgi:hypothetical protein